MFGGSMSTPAHQGISQKEKNMDWEESLHIYEKVIACESEALKIKATLRVGRLSNLAPDYVLARTVPILVELLRSPLNSSSPSIQEAAAYCLSRIARKGDGSLTTIIGQSGVLPCLLRLLSESQGRFRRVLIKCLWAIVICSSPCRAIVVRNGGLEIVLNLLASSMDDTRRYLLETLSSLSLLREVRRVIISFGGLPLLVEAARSTNMVSRARAAQAIGLLGVTRRVRQMLVDLGVIPVLIELLQEGDTSTKLVAGNALGIIASHIDYILPVAQAGAIPLFAELLQGSEHLGREIAEDMFCVLAVAESNAISISQHLVRILQGDDDESKAAAADVLWDLSGYKHSVSIVRNSGAIPILVELLQHGSDDVREKVSGAVAQLSYDEGDRVALADAGVIPLLINLLQDESEELKDNAAEALINFSEDPLQRERISEIFDMPSFQNMQNRLVQIRASDEHTVRSLRHMSIEQFTWDPVLG
ncbi:outer dynein arm-docking complex subunit 2 [Macadamia integrifolia]|uniref:outer dynein arm-docking complex subunit 2 n=1 Tax=Macadamia integrifolia TaxID=60698 RepID=UPI001C4EC289|nr:outer dynein arm-docking complex subunit 2 [Macadamia integrifolia]XP_042516492.1 outer dynein arm-docking complex subunit 2 [Macadamia integrifolia]XP_042516493.1 outer dynein arm-docking complex subunit 2 [Macadamia integrifolia]XP_042516494.1 outer dynein arm-docking complex subunit 2 [Macadamia integrifolia]XP_042516495.1 outer dynein arm-docking complex subunit 2 [Macadamia integrifolia]XP_042516496.1 outer dynein arm-docking complex subunit 2 [Macadamia integrifolia]